MVTESVRFTNEGCRSSEQSSESEDLKMESAIVENGSPEVAVLRPVFTSSQCQRRVASLCTMTNRHSEIGRLPSI